MQKMADQLCLRECQKQRGRVSLYAHFQSRVSLRMWRSIYMYLYPK